MVYPHRQEILDIQCKDSWIGEVIYRKAGANIQATTSWTQEMLLFIVFLVLCTLNFKQKLFWIWLSILSHNLWCFSDLQSHAPNSRCLNIHWICIKLICACGYLVFKLVNCLVLMLMILNQSCTTEKQLPVKRLLKLIESKDLNNFQQIHGPYSNLHNTLHY